MLSLERARASMSDKRGKITSRRRLPPATSEPDCLMACWRGLDFQHIYEGEKGGGGGGRKTEWEFLAWTLLLFLISAFQAPPSAFQSVLLWTPRPSRVLSDTLSTAQTLQCAVESALPDDKVALVLNPTAPSMLCPQHVTDLVWQRLGSHLIIHLDRVFWPSSSTTVCSWSLNSCLNLDHCHQTEGGLG